MVGEDIYGENPTKREDLIELKKREDLKKIYQNFFSDFRYYLIQFMKESLVELNISEIPIGTKPIRLFDDKIEGAKLVLKNQGGVECYITTAGLGGFRLDPGERSPELWLNKAINVVTLSGVTSLGLIRT